MNYSILLITEQKVEKFLGLNKIVQFSSIKYLSWREFTKINLQVGNLPKNVTFCRTKRFRKVNVELGTSWIIEYCLLKKGMKNS